MKALGSADVIGVLFRSMQPVHRDTGFTLGALKKLLETDSSADHVLVESALR